MLTLIEKEHLIDNVWAFRFKPEQPLTWIPGQFIEVKLEHETPDKEGVKRWFTVSSAPYEEIVQITTRVTNSTFKQALAALPIGGVLPMTAEPDGDFTWEDTDKPVIFLAGGIGITPFQSILKQRVHDGQPLNITLLYGNRTDVIPFKDELEGYLKTHPEFGVKYIVGEPLDVPKLLELEPKLLESLVYVSGPEPMVDELAEALRNAGLSDAQLKQDALVNYTKENY